MSYFITILVIAIVSTYLIFMIIYFGKRIKNKEGIVNDCDMCKNKGKRIIKYYYKQKKKEQKLNQKKQEV